MAKTLADLKALLQSWREDPSWDLDKTEGFEELRGELRLYQKMHETMKHEAYRQKALELAEGLGIPGNLALSYYLMETNDQIRVLRARVEELEHSLKEMVQKE